MIIKINNNYDFIDKDFMDVFNQELQNYADDFGWSYIPETKELIINLPDETNTSFLDKYIEIN